MSDDHLWSFLIEYTAYCVYIYPERAVPLRLNYSKYGDQLTDDGFIRLAVLLLDYNTREHMLEVRNIVLKDPEIKVRVRKGGETAGAEICWALFEIFLKCWRRSADPG